LKRLRIHRISALQTDMATCLARVKGSTKINSLPLGDCVGQEVCKRRRLNDVNMIKKVMLAADQPLFNDAEMAAARFAFVHASARYFLRKAAQGVVSGRKEDCKDFERYKDTTVSLQTAPDSDEYQRVLAESQLYEYVLVGRPDAREVDTEKVVTTKHRRNRLFGCIPLYEQVQLEAYLHLTDTRELGAIQVESFHSDQTVYSYEHNYNLWQRILVGFSVAVSSFDCMDHGSAVD
jgi:hypothetical protein